MTDDSVTENTLDCCHGDHWYAEASDENEKKNKYTIFLITGLRPINKR